MKSIAFSFFLLAFLCTKCTSFKMTVPSNYREHANVLHVRGLSYMFKQQLHIGNYITSKIHRGLVITNTRDLNNTNHFKPGLGEKLFNLQAVDEITNARHKYHYALFNESDTAEIFCFESSSKESLAFRSQKSIFRNISTDLYKPYNFSGAIVLNKEGNEWEMEMGNEVLPSSQPNTETGKTNYVEAGFIARGTDTIFILPLKNLTVTTSKGKTIPLPALGSIAYELEQNHKKVGMVDFMNEDIYLMNDVAPSVKTLVTSAATALLLRQISVQD